MFYVMYDATDVVVCDDWDAVLSNQKVGMTLYGFADLEDDAQKLVAKCEQL